MKDHDTSAVCPESGISSVNVSPRVADFDLERIHPRVEEGSETGGGAKINLELPAPAVAGEVNRRVNATSTPAAGLSTRSECRRLDGDVNDPVAPIP